MGKSCNAPCGNWLLPSGAENACRIKLSHAAGTCFEDPAR
jgi:hypothetical protein